MTTIVGTTAIERSLNSLSVQDRASLRGIIQELDDSMTRMDAERDLQKEILNDMEEKLGLDKKMIKKMAQTRHKSTFKDQVEENRLFEEFYEVIVNGTGKTNEAA